MSCSNIKQVNEQFYIGCMHLQCQSKRWYILDIYLTAALLHHWCNNFSTERQMLIFTSTLDNCATNKPGRTKNHSYFFRAKNIDFHDVHGWIDWIISSYLMCWFALTDFVTSKYGYLTDWIVLQQPHLEALCAHARLMISWFFFYCKEASQGLQALLLRLIFRIVRWSACHGQWMMER